MKQILVLGSGFVTGPLVDYLLNNNFSVTVASNDLAQGQELVKGKEKAKVVHLDAKDHDHLESLIKASDVTVCMLPHTFHDMVAHICLDAKTHFVTASYVTEKMKQLDSDAKKKGIILFNEIGLDPGLDHMSALSIINSIYENDGMIVSFSSYCGGIPAPEANTNPLGYKFSWSPKGLVLAGKRPATFKKKGEVIELSEDEIFSHFSLVSVPELGNFECYPNGNALKYIDTYGLQDVHTMFRGTLRYPGWCSLWEKIGKLGLLDQEKRQNGKDLTYSKFIRSLVGAFPNKSARKACADYLGLDENEMILDQLAFLDFFSDNPLPTEKTNLDILTTTLIPKLQYEKNERDMIILQHRIVARYPQHSREDTIVSTLIDYGVPGKETAMARTVGLPCAIVTKLIAQGKIKSKGVIIPTSKQVYKAILKELAQVGLVFTETVDSVDLAE